MSEIVIEKDDPFMDLNDDEQALLEEIEIDPTPLPVKRGSGRAARAQPQEIVDDPMAFMNPEKKSAPPENTGPTGGDEPIDYGENMEDDEPVFPEGPTSSPMDGGIPMDGPSPGFASIDDEKADILNKLTRLSQKKGIHVNKRLNMYSSIDELRAEIKRAKYSIEVEQSVKFSRRALIACVTGLEFLNKRYDPFDLKLEGWSESVMENVEDYDETFEELYVKYRSSVKVPPEVKLIMMVGGSGMMFHLTNSMFKSVMPNVNEVMKQNPGLMQNMMSAVQNTVQNRAAPAPEPPVNVGGRREMKGPGIDLGSLMGGMGMPMPPAPVNTFSGDARVVTPPVATSDPDPEIDDLSDIVSVVSAGDIEVRDVNIKPKAKRGGRRKKKTEKNEVSI